jgi:hypothetical protein
MNHNDEEQEHRDLQALFDGTAEAASGPTLTKLAARAADIPERASRKPRFFPRWAWGPAFAGAAMGLGALLALHATRHVEPGHAAQTASAAPTASFAVASAASSDREPATDEPRTAAAEEPADNLELLGDADEGAHFDVAGPQSDRDLDAWLAATKELSGGT